MRPSVHFSVCITTGVPDRWYSARRCAAGWGKLPTAGWRSPRPRAWRIKSPYVDAWLNAFTATSTCAARRSRGYGCRCSKAAVLVAIIVDFGDVDTFILMGLSAATSMVGVIIGNGLRSAGGFTDDA